MKVFMKGNEAIAEAALRAGCRAYFGYPITPQSEILEYMAKELPKRGGVFIQAESEIASIFMVYGAAAAGIRVMTSSSGPGISLKQEGISYLAMARLPCLIVNIMRGGPGLGDIQPSQADYFQATRGGGHGDYRTIVLAPSTVQEAADLTFLGFDLADQYRVPVLILGDGALGQMAEPVDFGPERELRIPPKPWALTGAQDRPRNTIVPFNLDPLVIERMNLELDKVYKEISDREVRYEVVNLEKTPDIIIVAFGLMGRIVKTVIKRAKEENIEVGLIRPITLWPFPTQPISQIAQKFGKDFLVVEMNLGQMLDDVEIAVKGKAEVHFYGRTGGIIPTAGEILDKIKEILGKGKIEKRGVMELEKEEEKLERPAKELFIPGKIYSRPEILTDTHFIFCPGCGHGIVHRILAEVIDELGIGGKTIGVFCIGCAALSTQYFKFDCILPAHGRAPAVATGIKRVFPDKIVFTYQGDGDLAAIGAAETLHTANRGENITVIFVNNAVYGMTGGQTAPTTLPGQKTTTSPLGRDPKTEGEPITVCELLSVLKRVAYITRVTVTSPKEVLKAKAAIKKAFQFQIEGRGYSFVEVLSPCPTNWRLSTKEALEWVKKEMIPYFPLGVFREVKSA